MFVPRRLLKKRPRRQHAPIPDEGVSRRGLFSLGLDRVIPDDASAAVVVPPLLEPVEVDEDAAARLSTARAAGEGELWEEAVSELVSAALVVPGERILDLMGGDGMLGEIAAQRLARVTCCDDAGELQGRARQRAAEEDQGGLEWVALAGPALPQRDGHFDSALSAFGVTNGLHAVRLIDEMARVTRFEGVLGLAVWADTGIVGRLLALAQERVPLPEEVTPPLAWDEDRLRAVLEPHTNSVEITRHSLQLEFESRAEAVQALLRGLPPLGAANVRDPLGMELAAAVDALAEPGEDALTITADYLVAVADRA